MSTTDELSSYYASLLILQYLQMPKAFALTKAIVEPMLMDQIPLAVQDAFNPATAVGKQLDVIGKYVGISRTGKGLKTQITLNDADFRTLIKLVLLRNNSGSSLATIQGLLEVNFPGQITVSDNQIMQLSYVLVESLGTSGLLEIITVGEYLPKPMGVQISVVVVPVLAKPFFGFVTYESPVNNTVAGFNHYELYSQGSIWLDYNGVP